MGCISSSVGPEQDGQDIIDKMNKTRIFGVSHSKPKRGTFHNWSGNIQTDFPVFTPKSDEDIKGFIAKAKREGKTLRVVGTAHSSSAAVTHKDESVLLIDLENYRSGGEGAPPDVQLFEDDASVAELGAVTVLVNSGWSVHQLYHFLTEHASNGKDRRRRYRLASQTSANQFSLGGLMMMPTNGGDVIAGPLPDLMVGLRLIDHEGSAVEVLGEEQTRMYRASMGVFGVVTHVRLKLARARPLTFTEEEARLNLSNEKKLASYFQFRLDLCRPPHNLVAQQYFVDMYKGKCLCLAWREERVARGGEDGGTVESTHYKADASKEGVALGGLLALWTKLENKLGIVPGPIDIFLLRAKSTVRNACHSNSKKHANDMFWASDVNMISSAHYMAYYFPVGEGCVNIAKALTAVKKALKRQSSIKKREFYLDLPVEFRFVRSSKSPLMPCFSEGEKEQWFAMEMPTLAANIFFDDERVSKEDKDSQKMNWEFREFFRDVETQWKAVDPRAKPHYAKVFGFDRAHETGKLTVFGGATTANILPEERRGPVREAAIAADPKGVFANDFVRGVLGYRINDVEVTFIPE